MSDETTLGRSGRDASLRNGQSEETPRPISRDLLGEVVGASYSEFTVESYELHDTPPLGQLVVVQDTLGIVCDAHTEGLGPISAKGARNDADGDVYRIHPELSRTLRSQFGAMVVGYYAPGANLPQESRRLIYTYPETPPRLHYKAYRCTDAELLRFTAKPNYLRLLLQSQDAPVDEMLIHLLARAYRVRNNDHDHLLQTTEYLGRLLKGQYDRLVAILETLGTMIGEDA